MKLNARDFAFDVPLPPRPAGGVASWRIVPQAGPAGVPARLEVTSHADDPSPHLAVVVKLTEKVGGKLPTGYAGTLLAGWTAGAAAALVHVRVTLDTLAVKNALKPQLPVVHDAKGWGGQMAVNGEWQTWKGLADLRSGDRLAQALVWEQWLPADGSLQILSDATSRSCIDTLFAIPLLQAAREISLTDLASCLKTSSPNPGRVETRYPGPDFGAGSHVSASKNADGGACSTTTTRTCVSGDDCPAGETCVPSGSAYDLEYRIEKLP